MNVKSSQRVETNVVEMEIEVGREEFDAAINRAHRRSAAKINVPGFRKGHAPRKIIERMYGPEVFFEDAVNLSYPDAYRDAIDSLDIQPVEQANIEVLDVSADGYSFKARVTVRPEVTVGQYKGVSAVRPDTNVSDELVAEEVERLRDRGSRLVTVEREVKTGDTAVFDFKGFVDEVPFEGGSADGFVLEIGSGRFIPGFEDQMIGLKAGEEKDVNVTFPEEYHAEELKGKPAVFKVKMLEVKEKQLPELDDEFAKDVSEFDTLKELQDDIRKRLTERFESQSDTTFEANVLDQVIATMEGEIPDIMVDNQAQDMMDDMGRRLSMQGMNMETYLSMTGMTADKMLEELRPEAERQVKITLALDKIVAEEGMTLSDEELDQEYKRLMEQTSQPRDRIKAIIGEKRIIRDVLALRALELLKKEAKVLAPSEQPPAEEKPKAKKPAAKKADGEKAKPAAKKKAEATATEEKAKPAAKKTAAKAKTTDAEKKPAAKKTTKKAASGEEK